VQSLPRTFPHGSADTQAGGANPEYEQTFHFAIDLEDFLPILTKYGNLATEYFAIGTALRHARHTVRGTP
jgi:hypothetical protein